MSGAEIAEEATGTEEPARRGGLPEDDGALDAFAAAAQGAFRPRRRRRSEDSGPEEAVSAPTEAAEEPAPETTEPPAAPAPVSAPVAVAAPASARVPATRAAASLPAEQGQQSRQLADGSSIVIPELGEMGTKATQCTVMVSDSVRQRFAHYQLAKKMEKGSEPTNAVVVRRAVIHARKNNLFPQLLESVRQRQQPVDEEDYDPDDLFGDVPGRRTERGRMKNTVQQSFRPSYQELAVIDALSEGYGFPSRSDFMDAVLDAFLPSLPNTGRSRKS